MLADALREVRQHPGRIVATLIAIAIAVGFMAATSVFLATEKSGLAKQLNQQYAPSDVLVTRSMSDAPDSQVLSQITGTPGVDAAEPALASGGSLTGSNGTSLYVQIYGVPGEKFRWSSITEGAWPTGLDQVALPADVAKKLGVGVGGTVTSGEQKLTVSGLTDDPASRLLSSAYVSPELIRQQGAQGPDDEQPPSYVFVVKVTPGTNVADVVTALQPLTQDDGFAVQDTQSYLADQLNDLTQGIDALKYALMVFAVIALLVGMIIIANTFTILITQRRRQIGLLRAVGASTSQIRRKFLAEAIIIGALGSLLGLLLGTGIAAIGSALSGSLHWGMSLPGKELSLEFGVGVLVTLLAALVPVWRTSRVAPLEALRPVLSADSQKRVSLVRAIICTVLLAAGVVLSVVSLVAPFDSGSAAPVAYALGSAALITIAVLGAAPLYVALLIKAWGKLIGITGPTSRLATMNAARNPQRAAATSVALMLAIGLIITLQVGTATVRKTATDEINDQYPVDVSVSITPMEPSDTGALPADVKAVVDQMSNVKTKLLITGGYRPLSTIPVLQFDPAMRDIAPSLPAELSDDQVILSEATLGFLGGTKDSVDLIVGDRTVTLKPIINSAGDVGTIVSPATMATLVENPVEVQYWIKLTDRSEFASSMTALNSLQTTHPTMMVGGGAVFAFLIDRILNIILGVTTALLGVAVAIALVGVANTLGLSVIERTRESALLRALGMTRSKLRIMLLIEAVTLALVGVVVGALAGIYFAWLGIRSVFRATQIGRAASFTVDLPQTLGLIGVAIVASALASILPGRRAAMATPTEALAAD